MESLPSELVSEIISATLNTAGRASGLNLILSGRAIYQTYLYNKQSIIKDILMAMYEYILGYFESESAMEDIVEVLSMVCRSPSGMSFRTNPASIFIRCTDFPPHLEHLQDSDVITVNSSLFTEGSLKSEKLLHAYTMVMWLLEMSGIPAEWGFENACRYMVGYLYRIGGRSMCDHAIHTNSHDVYDFWPGPKKTHSRLAELIQSVFSEMLEPAFINVHGKSLEEFHELQPDCGMPALMAARFLSNSTFDFSYDLLKGSEVRKREVLDLFVKKLCTKPKTDEDFVEQEAAVAPELDEEDDEQEADVDEDDVGGLQPVGNGVVQNGVFGNLSGSGLGGAGDTEWYWDGQNEESDLESEEGFDLGVVGGNEEDGELEV